MGAHATVPDAATFSAAPLRNRLRLQLDRSVDAVWDVIGNLSRLPEYSDGLERVESQTGADGACVAFTCHFKPKEAGQNGIVDTSIVRWYAHGLGYASSALADTAFGVSDDLNLVLVEPSGEGTLVIWEEYYDATDLPVIRAQYDDAFADIAARLIRRFGGRVLERTVDGPRSPAR